MYLLMAHHEMLETVVRWVLGNSAYDHIHQRDFNPAVAN